MTDTPTSGHRRRWPNTTPMLAIPLAAALLFAACSGADDSTVDQSSTTQTTATTVAAPAVTAAAPAPIDLPEGTVRTTFGDTTGNRFTPGRGTLPDVAPVDIELTGVPRWVVGADSADGLTWVVALEDGRLEGWRVEDGQAVVVPLDVDSLPPATPPVVIGGDGGIAVIEPPADASQVTFPVPLPDGGLVYATADGTIVTQVGDQVNRFEVNSLPDTRITISDDGLVAVLAEATTRYPHGVLGDDFEAGRVTIIDPEAGEIVAEAVVPEPAVIEGIAAPWVDVDGDGSQEILVTVSDGSVGAQLVVFDRQGELVAEGPPIGRANRWRNQLGAGPIGPNGEIEIIDVRVPHIGGVVEFFQFEDGQLITNSELRGFTSHVFGSRNLDMALAADADGDGQFEVVIPNQDLDMLGLLRRTVAGTEVVGEVELPGTLTTNLAAAPHRDGSLSFAAGTDDAVLRIWQG